MATFRRLRGTELRYVLTIHLFDHGRASVADLAAALTAQGFDVGGRASKSISDALRWEMGHGRVYRRGRGVYGPGWMPRSTEYRIHRRVLALRAEAQKLSLEGGQLGTSPARAAGGATVRSGRAGPG
jgi:hypothetical protein